MSVLFRGDFTKLGSAISRLQGTISASARQDLTRVLGATALAKVQSGFRDTVNPYGTAWDRLKIRTGQPLRDTGRLMNSFNSRHTPTGFIISSNVKYGVFHQYGTKHIPRRQMVPEDSLPESWTLALKAEISKFIHDRMAA